MAKYLFEARYSAEGAKGLAREGGSGRRAAMAKMTEGLGGTLETFYYASVMSTCTPLPMCPTA